MMTQVSGPLVGEPFTDEQWRTATGRQGIVHDYTGTAYALTLPTGSNDVVVGPGKSVVAGFGHEVPVGETHDVTIPESTNPTIGRTDVIAVAYDPTYSTVPGPCRLLRIAGTEGSTALPSMDQQPPGVEVMPLWAVTRKQGEGLNQAVVASRRRWVGPSLVAQASLSPLPPSSLGTTYLRGDSLYVRRLSAADSPEWFGVDLTNGTIDQSRLGDAVVATSGIVSATPAGWVQSMTGFATSIARVGPLRTLSLYARRSTGGDINFSAAGGVDDFEVATLHPNHRPSVRVTADLIYKMAGSESTIGGFATIETDGSVIVRGGSPNTTISNRAAAAGYSVFASATYL